MQRPEACGRGVCSADNSIPHLQLPTHHQGPTLPFRETLVSGAPLPGAAGEEGSEPGWAGKATFLKRRNAFDPKAWSRPPSPLFQDP